MPSAWVCPWAIAISDAVDYVDQSKKRAHVEFIGIGDCITSKQVKSGGIELLSCMDQQRASVTGFPRTVLHVLVAVDDRPRPWLANGQGV